jgi:hypothetical protein
MRLRNLCLVPGDMRSVSSLTLPLAGFAILVFPFTHIAGVDTYKWQDLATVIQVEQRIPWLVHSASLFGFTPRSYPLAQPAYLSSIQILGQLGVDGGFYVLSILCGALGLFSAYALGHHLFRSARLSFWFAFLYVFSPVFLRYNYWATGRGLLTGLLPLFLMALLSRPQPVAWAGAVFAGVLMGLAHKAGLVAAILIPAGFLTAPLLRWVTSRWARAMLLTGALLAGLALGGHGPFSLLFRAIARLGWLLPLATAGLFIRTNATGLTLHEGFDGPTGRRMLACGGLLLPLVFTDDMYGTLIILPFAAYVAAIGLETLAMTVRGWKPTATYALAAVLTLMAAGVVVARQGQDSPSEPVYRAAEFLERHDPHGPYRIEAPGRARTQMQAYVSGCPRFTVHTARDAALQRRPFPRLTGNWPADLRSLVGYLRTILDLSGATTDWYGSGDRVYYVTVGGDGFVPSQAPLLFTSGNVSVFGAPPR